MDSFEQEKTLTAIISRNLRAGLLRYGKPIITLNLSKQPTPKTNNTPQNKPRRTVSASHYIIPNPCIISKDRIMPTEPNVPAGKPMQPLDSSAIPVKRVYPWNEWLNGKRYRLIRGIHYFMATRAFTAAVHTAAARNGKRIYVAQLPPEDVAKVLKDVTIKEQTPEYINLEKKYTSKPEGIEIQVIGDRIASIPTAPTARGRQNTNKLKHNQKGIREKAPIIELPESLAKNAKATKNVKIKQKTSKKKSSKKKSSKK